MEKKYYYDCPIKALYMMKEFGVNLKCENESSSYYYSFGKAMLDHIRREVLKDTTWEKNLGKIYVAPESEHIFQPKEGDFVSNYLHGNKSRHCHGFLSAQSNLTTSATIITPERKNGMSYFVESKSQITIIMRDNKHFFTPKEEN